MTTSRLGGNFTRIIRQVNCSTTLTSPYKVKVLLPGGFPYESFNPRACVTPRSLNKLMETACCASFGANYIDAIKIFKHYYIFTVASSTSVSTELYNAATLKGPLVNYLNLDYVGRTSFRLKAATHIEGNEEPIFKTDVQSVFVSIKTEKPAPPPDWWIQKYSLSANNGEALKLKHLEPPSDGIVYENDLEVPVSDVDPYLHVSWAHYITYFYESYVKRELKKNKSGDPRNLFRNLKQFSLSCMQEASIGDKLKIRFWENKNTKDLFHCHLLKGQEVMTECSFELLPIS